MFYRPEFLFLLGWRRLLISPPLCAHRRSVSESVTAVTVNCGGHHTRVPSFRVNTHIFSRICPLVL